MKNLSFFLFFSTAMVLAPCCAAEPNPKVEVKKTTETKENDNPIVWFIPPTGWGYADPSMLPPTVKIMVIGKGKNPMPPSMNLTAEPYKGTLKQYLKIVKGMNDAQGYEWKDLGSINTASGPASLSQVETKTEWGTVKLMHVITLKDGMIYILTAAALKEEFSDFYKDFFASMRTLKISKNLIDSVKPVQRQNDLKEALQKVKLQWKEMVTQEQKLHPELSLDKIKEQVFESDQFKSKAWTPFKEFINQKFADMDAQWQALALVNTENELFEINP